VTWTSRYNQKLLPKVEIEKILPNVSTDELFSHRKCYLGISLENPVFNVDSLAAMLFWASEHFDQCKVIVGDYLCRFNERILKGLDNSAAETDAEELGRVFIEKAANLFAELPADKIILTRWKDHLQSDEFNYAKTILDDLFANEPDFTAAVEKDAFSFVKRHQKRGNTIAVTTEQAIELSCKYILEETAVFSALSEQGWNVELYPGSELNVLAEIAKGNFITVPQGLKKRINVELKITT